MERSPNQASERFTNYFFSLRLLKLLTSNQKKIKIKGRKLFAITDLVISSLLAHKMARLWKQSDTCSFNNLESLCSTSPQQICKHSAKKDGFVIPDSDKEIAAGG